MKASDYNPEQLMACESVLLELHRILGTIWQHVVIVGGWVPTLLANNADTPHQGTTDIDLALNHLLIPEDSYQKIHELLTKHGYEQNDDKAKQFQYFRYIELANRKFTVIVDLLTGEYEVESGKNRRHEPIQDANVLKARGVDLVFDRFEIVTISGELPNGGGTDKAECKVASVCPIIVMKSAAMAGRLKDKDSYDLYYFVKNYPGGLASVLKAITPDIDNGLFKEAIERIKQYYESTDSSGPAWVARFLGLTDNEEIAVQKMDVYQTMQALLEGIDSIRRNH
ncbi:MAG: hypothetical protein WC028_16350 [Candidatus Obscuribacterales bacterium]